MIPTTTYKAFDGSIFDTAKDCADYETHCKTIASIIDQIPRFPIDGDFMEGKTYYQHDERIILPARDDFFKYLDTIYNNPQIQYPNLRFSIGQPNLLDRLGFLHIFVKHNDKASILAWNYLGCIDDEFRQWGQIAFAVQAPEGARAIND